MKKSSYLSPCWLYNDFNVSVQLCTCFRKLKNIVENQLQININQNYKNQKLSKYQAR